MKNLLIITGPQGSGNHLWSKIFAASKNMYGWSALNDTYWIPHDQEPFAEAWHNPSKLKDIDIWPYSWAVTSISCPYAYQGNTVEPDYQQFITAAQKLDYNVKIAIIGRDQNVLQHQQERVRGTHSFNRFVPHINLLLNLDPVFLSTELLYLYKENYLRSIEKALHFKLNVPAEKLAEILITDPNSKYFKAAEAQELDKYVRYVSGLSD
jgi:hypothetical protein